MPSIVLNVADRRPSSSVDLTLTGVVTGVIAYVRSPSAILPMAIDRSLRQCSSRLVIRSLRARTGRTTERVTQTASAIAIRIATITTMSIRREPLACVAFASLDGGLGVGDGGGGELGGRGLHVVVQREQLALVHRAGAAAVLGVASPSRCARPRAPASAASSISARMAAQAANFSSTVEPLKSCSSLPPSALLLAQLASISLKCSSCLAPRSPSLTYRCRRDEADVVLGALLHAPEQFCGDELALAEVLGLVLEAGESVHAREGDNRQRQAQNTERATEARGDRQIADRGHGLSVGPRTPLIKGL